MSEIQLLSNDWGEFQVFMVDNDEGTVGIITRDTESGEVVAYKVQLIEVVQDQADPIQNWLDSVAASQGGYVMSVKGV